MSHKKRDGEDVLLKRENELWVCLYPPMGDRSRTLYIKEGEKQ